MAVKADVIIAESDDSQRRAGRPGVENKFLPEDWARRVGVPVDGRSDPARVIESGGRCTEG